MGTKVGITSQATESHQVDISLQAPVSMIGDMVGSGYHTGFIDDGIGSAESDWVLVSGEFTNFPAFSKEMSRGNLSDTLDRCADLKILAMNCATTVRAILLSTNGDIRNSYRATIGNAGWKISALLYIFAGDL